METDNPIPRKTKDYNINLSPDRDEINLRYSPYFTATYFNLLNAAYTGELDSFKMVASSYDKRGDGLAKTIQRLVDGDGRGSLAFAAAGGRVDVCRFLVEELNLDVDVKDNKGLTPLCFGAVKGHLNTIEYLLQKGANPNGSDDPSSRTNTPLHYAILGGNKKIQSLLLSKGVRINVATRSGTALTYAVVLGRLDAVKLLLDHRADPNAELYGVVTPLMASIFKESLEIMNLLLQAGADPNVKARGLTPLLYAASLRVAPAITRLLEAGADPNALDINGTTAVEIAASFAYPEIVDILFPVTSRIPTYPNWTVGGLMEHVHSEIAKRKTLSLATPRIPAYPNGMTAIDCLEHVLSEGARKERTSKGYVNYIQGRAKASEAFQEKKCILPGSHSKVSHAPKQQLPITVEKAAPKETFCPWDAKTYDLVKTVLREAHQRDLDRSTFLYGLKKKKLELFFVVYTIFEFLNDKEFNHVSGELQLIKERLRIEQKTGEKYT